MSDATQKCPICKARTVRAWRPFCSRRCADIDLGKWMTGAYALPSEEPLEESDIAEIEARLLDGEDPDGGSR